MKLTASLLTLAALTLAAPLRAAEAPAADAFFFRDGDRAMILGDSITEGRTYSTLMESYVLSRFPNWNITFRNTGWSGDTMGLRTRNGLDKGFDRDLKPLEATAVTINFGMNDARAGDAGYSNYLSSAKTLVDKFAAQGARVALITSSPEEKYQDGQPAGSAYNLMLRKYSDGLKTVATEKNVPFVDQLAPMIEVIESGRKSGVLALAGEGARLIPDAVHPGAAGGLVMAASILKGLNAPALVSRVEFDAASGKVTAEKATVSDVKTGGTLSFVRLDEAMPWPLPADSLMATKIPGFNPLDDLSRYELKVSNLTAPKYLIEVDGKSIGTFTKEELAAGLNLSTQVIPAMPEVGKLLGAIKAKNAIYFSLWRDVRVSPVPEWIPKDLLEQARAVKEKELTAKLAEADAALAKLRIPEPHLWTLTPAS